MNNKKIEPNIHHIIASNLWMLFLILFHPSLTIILIIFTLRDLIILKTTSYTFSEKDIKIKTGIISTEEIIIIQEKINSLSISQNLLQKLTKSIDINILTGNDVLIIIKNIKESDFELIKPLFKQLI